MTVIDVTLLVILGGFILAGFWFGLVHMIGALVGLVLATVLSGRFYDDLAVWMGGFLSWNENLLKVLAFIILFTLITRLVGLIVHFADKALHIIGIIPFVKTFNRLLGAVLGLIEGTLALGLIVYVMARFPINAPYELLLRNSVLVHKLYPIGELLTPLLPEALKTIQSVI